MYKMTETYEDYNGTKRTEDFYFNLNKAELLDLQMSYGGQLQNTLQKMVSANDSDKLLAFFKDILLRSYGEKSDDGRRFIKNEETRNNFTQTEAFSQIYLKLTQNETESQKFVRGIMPADIQEKVDSQETSRQITAEPGKSPVGNVTPIR